MSRMGLLPEMCKAKELPAKWRKQAIASREESGRIRRTIMEPTDAESNCLVRAELWDICADELDALLAEPVEAPQGCICASLSEGLCAACVAMLRSQMERWKQMYHEAIGPVEAGAGQEPFQARVRKWTLECFGQAIADDKVERNHRFLEESLELVQALGCTQSEAHQLVDYVFGRPQGHQDQECGGVLVTLAALCNANGLDMRFLGDMEFARVWNKIEQIRAKQAAKPKHSPLSEPPAGEPRPLDASEIEFILKHLPERPSMQYIVQRLTALATREAGKG